MAFPLDPRDLIGKRVTVGALITVKRIFGGYEVELKKTWVRGGTKS